MQVAANGRPSWRLISWSGWNGTTFTVRKTLFVAGKKFDGFNGIGFGADGRLYVGVDVGLTDGNDHGPASTSPYLYDILTFRADGTDLHVFAKGMRQPWQLAFQPGSNAPFVTDLGQDSGAKNPPDFVLHVHAGDNYGFPTCNHTVAKKCQGFTKPFPWAYRGTDGGNLPQMCVNARIGWPARMSRRLTAGERRDTVAGPGRRAFCAGHQPGEIDSPQIPASQTREQPW